MKLKFIKDSERVINAIDFDIIHTICREHNDLFEDAMAGQITYSITPIPLSKGVIVYIENNKSAFPIKVFNTDDPEYNRTCAENLVTLLNSDPLDQKE